MGVECSLANLQHIFRTPFYKDTFEGLLLVSAIESVSMVKILCNDKITAQKAKNKKEKKKERKSKKKTQQKDKRARHAVCNTCTTE